MPYFQEDSVVNPSQCKPSPLRHVSDPKAIDMVRILGLSQKTDVIKMLVSIFGNKDLFIEEYRKILASKLLATSNYDTAEEVTAPRTVSHELHTRWPVLAAAAHQRLFSAAFELSHPSA